MEMETLAAIDVPLRLQHMAAALETLLVQRGVLIQGGADVVPGSGQGSDVSWVGIQTGGVWVAQHLRALMANVPDQLGQLNISFYRDDFSRQGLHPSVTPSHLPFDIEDQHVILVDDVLMTGRTIRAALNELFDYGRPASVTLVVLVSMGGRELPIAADVAGVRLQLPAHKRIKIRGPEPLRLEEVDLSS